MPWLVNLPKDRRRQNPAGVTEPGLNSEVSEERIDKYQAPDTRRTSEPLRTANSKMCSTFGKSLTS